MRFLQKYLDRLSWRKKRTLERVWGPTGSVILHILVILALAKLLVGPSVDKTREIEASLMELDAKDLEEFDKLLEELEPPPEIDMSMAPVVATDTAVPDTPTETQKPFEEPVALEIKTDLPSKLIMKDLYNGRSADGRKRMLGQYARGRAPEIEAAVNKALEWLKNHQEPDGSWKGEGGASYPAAMTGLGLLTFLAHGETVSSERYGPTVEKAIKWLLEAQDEAGYFVKPSQPGVYAHAIATYAVSEAYGLTRIMALKTAMDRAIQTIVDGQQPLGGFDYSYNKGARRDASVLAWQVQALKAAYISGTEVSGVREALDKAVSDLRHHVNPETGRFDYSEKGKGGTAGITGIGVLSMQLCGRGNDPIVARALNYLKSVDCDWDTPGGWKLYGWYYVTQAKFHGQTVNASQWEDWNKLFSPVFLKSQNEDGSWDPPGAKSGKSGEQPYGRVYSTALAALTLQVYYRYGLATYKDIAVEILEPVIETENDVAVTVTTESREDTAD